MHEQRYCRKKFGFSFFSEIIIKKYLSSQQFSFFFSHFIRSLVTFLNLYVYLCDDFERRRENRRREKNELY